MIAETAWTSRADQRGHSSGYRASQRILVKQRAQKIGVVEFFHAGQTHGCVRIVLREVCNFSLQALSLMRF